MNNFILFLVLNFIFNIKKDNGFICNEKYWLYEIEIKSNYNEELSDRRILLVFDKDYNSYKKYEIEEFQKTIEKNRYFIKKNYLDEIKKNKYCNNNKKYNIYIVDYLQFKDNNVYPTNE